MSRSYASTRLLTAHVRTMDLEPLALADDAVTAGTPTTHALALGAIADVEIGLWEITAGVVSDIEYDEVFVVVSGRGRLVFADQSSLELRPGTAVQLRAGDHTRWIIEQTVRKVYLCPRVDDKDGTTDA